MGGSRAPPVTLEIEHSHEAVDQLLFASLRDFKDLVLLWRQVLLDRRLNEAAK